MFHKTKDKNKKWFCESCLQCFGSENVLIKHKEDCLSISGQQSINLEKGTTEFKNYFNNLIKLICYQFHLKFPLILSVILKILNVMKVLTQKKYHEHVPCSYAYEVVCIDDRFSKPIVVYRGENAAYKFIKAILKERKYCKKIMKDQFNKNLFMTEEEEYLFQQSNNCWICEKIIDNDDEKVIVM